MSSSSNQPIVAVAADLKVILDEYVKGELKKRPKGRTDGFRNEKIPFYGIKQYLSDQSGVSVHTINTIMKGEVRHTSLKIADAILSAMERPDLLHTDVRVVPNPRWGQEKWLAWKAACDSE